MTHEQAVKWMANHGHLGYANEIQALLSAKHETLGEAGQNWQHCPFIREKISKIDDEIAEVQRCAWERYEDWRTDALD